MFPILQHKKYGYFFSGALILVSLFFLFTPGYRLSLGIDFTGGTEIVLGFDEGSPSREEISGIYNEVFGEGKNPKMTIIEGGKEVMIRSHTLSSEEVIALEEKFLQKNFPATVEGISTVGSSLGDYFKTQAIWVTLLALLALVSFVAWAFRKVPAGIPSWKFGLSAIIALIHDVVITCGVFAFLGQFLVLEVDTMFVTAMLTVLGFSVHDTIVVFDRLRENLKGKKSSLLEKIAEESLWQTMGRSIHTSVSTLFVLVAMLIWGAPSIFAFVFALAFGIFIGTYSSIFIATPILVDWAKVSIAEFNLKKNEEE